MGDRRHAGRRGREHGVQRRPLHVPLHAKVEEPRGGAVNSAGVWRWRGVWAGGFPLLDHVLYFTALTLNFKVKSRQAYLRRFVCVRAVSVTLTHTRTTQFLS